MVDLSPSCMVAKVGQFPYYNGPGSKVRNSLNLMESCGQGEQRLQSEDDKKDLKKNGLDPGFLLNAVELCGTSIPKMNMGIQYIYICMFTCASIDAISDGL